MKKFWLLVALLIGPLIFYLLILLVDINATFLPVINNKVVDVSSLEPNQKIQFKNHINIVGFLGENLLQKKTNALNLNEKIYKPYYKFDTFQIVIIVPLGTEEKVIQLKKELQFTTNIKNWKFVFSEKSKIKLLYNTLKTTVKLDANSYSSEVFIIDKDGYQRGRIDDEDALDGKLSSYNAESVSFIHKKMVDDLKIVLEEYRRALKKNKKKGFLKEPYKKKK